jgi:hypothetical protein
MIASGNKILNTPRAFPSRSGDRLAQAVPHRGARHCRVGQLALLAPG